MILSILKYVLIVTIIEFIVNLFIFPVLNRKYGPASSSKNATNQEKGIIERLILSIGLILNIHALLIVFGTLKIGTRFASGEDKVKDDYFLIGNLVSILIAVIIYFTWYTNIYGLWDCVSQ